MGTQAVVATHGIAGPYIHREVHATSTGVDQLRRYRHQVADANGRNEANAADGHCDAVISAPAHRRRIAHLVDPFHDHAAVHLAAIVDVRRFGQETESQFALLAT